MTQCERILRHLQDYGSITQAEAVTEYGCYRLLPAGCKDLGFESARNPHPLRAGDRQNRYDEPVSFSRYSIVKTEREV